MNAYLRAIRLERWPRSLAIFLGPLAFFFLHREYLNFFSIKDLIVRGILAFLLTWAISTVNYIINEIADAPYDIHHPTKRYRPLVSGEIRKIPIMLFAVGLTGVSLPAASQIFPWPFSLFLTVLLAAGFIYNIRPIRTKDVPFLDCLSESVNNPIRFLIGWFAFAPENIFPPTSLLLSWWAFGSFLMGAKRLSEFRFLRDKAGDYRISLKKYSKASLLWEMIASALVFYATYFYFVVDSKLQFSLYLSPLSLLFFLIIFRKTLREQEVMEEPEKLIQHLGFALFTLLLIGLYFLSFFIDKVGQ